jgi:hypothetical protein
MTWRQSNNQWIGGITAHLARKKNASAKILWKNFSPRFFRDQDGSLLIDYLPKDQTIKAGYYSSLLVQLKYILKEKRHGNFTKWVLFLHEMPRLTGHLKPRRNWPTWASSVLITHRIHRI